MNKHTLRGGSARHAFARRAKRQLKWWTAVKFGMFFIGIAVLLCLHWAKQAWTPSGSQAQYADAFLAEFERTSFRHFGYEIGLSFNSKSSAEPSPSATGKKSKPTSGTAVGPAASITADELENQYKRRVELALQLRERIHKQIPKQSWRADLVDSDSDLNLLFRILQLLGWGAILTGIYALVSESKLDYLQKSVELFKLRSGERSSSAVASILMVGSVAAGSAYLSNTEVMAASPAKAANPANAPKGPGGGTTPPGAGELEALKASLAEYSVAITVLTNNVEIAAQNLSCAKDAQTGKCTPVQVELGAASNTLLVQAIKGLRDDFDQKAEKINVDVAKISEATRAHTAALQIVAHEVGAMHASTRTESERQATQTASFQSTLSAQLAGDLKATTTLAARLAIMRWAQLTKGKATDFSELKLDTMARVSKANSMLDQLDASVQEEAWYFRPYRLFVPSETAQCLRGAMPDNPEFARLPGDERPAGVECPIRVGRAG